MYEGLKTVCGAVEVRRECGGRAVAVALAEWIEDRAVLGDLRRLVLPVELQEHQAQLALGALVRRRQASAPEGRDEDAMELEVALERLEGVTPVERLRERVGRVAELLDALGPEPAEARLLQHEPQAKEVGDVVGRQIRHDDAPVRVMRDEPLFREPAQRFAQRVARHAEGRSELRLPQVGAGQELPLENELPQCPLHLRAGGRPVDRRDEGFRAHASVSSTWAIRSSALPRNDSSNPTVMRRWPSLPIIEPGTTRTDACARIASATCSDGSAAAYRGNERAVAGAGCSAIRCPFSESQRW